MPRKVFGNKKKFWGPLKHQKIYFFQKWTFGVVPTMALVTRMSHKSSNVVELRFTSRNHAPETIFWNFWNPSLKDALLFEQRFRLLLPVLHWILEYIRKFPPKYWYSYSIHCHFTMSRSNKKRMKSKSPSLRNSNSIVFGATWLQETHYAAFTHMILWWIQDYGS